MSTAAAISEAEVAALADELERAPAERVLERAFDRFGERIVLTCSWQRQSSVLVHMASQLAPGLRVVEFDTGLLFPETYETRERLIARYPVKFERIEPALTLDQQADRHGQRLWERDPDACCEARKVAPLRQALAGMDAWITGIRREQSTTRRTARKIEKDERRGVVKIQPLADWTSRDVWRYIWRHDIPYNPLHDHGFPSIGCIPCTTSVRGATADERSGRWRGTGKIECGLHGR
ncbi:MAG TPA: phosphoadenylyl-sulfate reductase [Gaiellales bacterium]|nr:phosphoadenylyl-sulfate reductase [Gaiellales bacterium]